MGNDPWILLTSDTPLQHSWNWRIILMVTQRGNATLWRMQALPICCQVYFRLRRGGHRNISHMKIHSVQYGRIRRSHCPGYHHVLIPLSIKRFYFETGVYRYNCMKWGNPSILFQFASTCWVFFVAISHMVVQKYSAQLHMPHTPQCKLFGDHINTCTQSHRFHNNEWSPGSGTSSYTARNRGNVL